MVYYWFIFTFEIKYLDANRMRYERERQGKKRDQKSNTKRTNPLPYLDPQHAPFSMQTQPTGFKNTPIFQAPGLTPIVSPKVQVYLPS